MCNSTSIGYLLAVKSFLYIVVLRTAEGDRSVLNWKGVKRMKKKFRSFSAFALSALLIYAPSFHALAAENNPKNSDSTVVSEETIRRLNPWIFYNDEENRYEMKAGSEEALDLNDFKLANQYLSAANASLDQVDITDTSVTILAPEDEYKQSTPSRKARAAFHEGITKMEFHWWGARIYLSRTTIQFLGAGTTIGGIWIPEPLVSKILASLGAVITTCPGGIVFDYNYMKAGIQMLSPAIGLIFPAVSNIRWQ